jgi:transposase
MARKSLSRLEDFVVMVGTGPVWIGIDAHKKDYHVGLVGGHDLKHGFVTPADPEGFVKKVMGLRLKVALVAYEAGPYGFGLARALERSGLPVTVAAPSRIPRPVTKGAKTDRLDCLQLAHLARGRMLRPIAIPSEQDEQRRLLARRRHKLVDDRRRVKGRIKSLLFNQGISEPDGLSHWSNQSIAALRKLKLKICVRLTLQGLLRDLKHFQVEIRTVEKHLKRLSEHEDYRIWAECLQSITGIGLITSMTYLLELFNPKRFNRAEEVASYLGLAPMVRQSGEGKAQTRLVQVGQKRLRSLLVEAAWVWKSKDPWAQQTYNRLYSKHGLPQKAIVALARKLAVLMWRLVIDERKYVSKPVAN